MNLRLTLMDFAALSPMLILLGFALLILLLESFAETFARKWSSYLTLAAIAIAAVAAVNAPISNNKLLTDWLRFDSISHFFTLFFLAISFATVLISSSFFTNFDPTRGEY